MRDHFSYPVQVRWSDIDPNRHLRHSVYYDYAASARVDALSTLGLTMKKFEELLIGPILFREEAIFRREILYGDDLLLKVAMIKATEDFSRWSLTHSFEKKDGVVAATLVVDGAWLDLAKRKLATPAPFITEVFHNFPRHADFAWTVPTDKKD